MESPLVITKIKYFSEMGSIVLCLLLALYVCYKSGYEINTLPLVDHNPHNCAFTAY